jgi:hypothetical protein
MAGKKTFVAGEVLLAQDVNDYLMDQSVMTFASSAARSSAIPTPTEGMFAVTTDDDELGYYNGSAWVPAARMSSWITFTPSFAGVTLGTGSTVDARYLLVGKTLHIRVGITLGTGGSMGAGPYMTLPASLVATGISPSPLWMIDASVQFFTGIAYSTSNIIVFYVNNATSTYGIVNSVGPAVPFGTNWGVGDQLFFNMSFEVN